MEAAELMQKIVGLQPALKEMTEDTDCMTVIVGAEGLVPLARALRDMPELDFDLLADHTAVDWLPENRFELIYHLISLQHGHTIRVSCSVPRDAAVVPTLCAIWPT